MSRILFCMTLKSRLLAVSAAFAQERGLSLSRVSTIVLNDGKALLRLEAGGDITTGTFERAMAWFSANWPEGAEWPADVPRPPASPEPSEDAA